MKNEVETLAQVPKITDWQQANEYLQNLRKTINYDVLPLLDTVGSAPFAINREVMSYIDHLGHLYSGKGQVGDRSKKYGTANGYHILTGCCPNPILASLPCFDTKTD